MRIPKEKAFVLLGGLLVLGASTWSLRCGLAGYCSNETLSEAVSSDGKRTATAFERNCGATTPFVRIVSVRMTDTAFDAEAENRYVFVVDGQPELRVAWDGPDNLSVKFGGGGRIVRQVLIWYGVIVSYD